MSLKQILKKRTPVEKLRYDVEKGKKNKSQYMEEMSILFGRACFVFYARTSYVKEEIQERKKEVVEIKKEIDMQLNNVYTDEWCRNISIKRLKMEKQLLDDLRETIESRNMLLNLDSLDIIARVLQLQEAFPDDNWSLVAIMHNALDEKVQAAVLKNASELQLELQSYPTIKELNQFRKFLMTSWVINYGCMQNEDIKIFNENGLIRGICNNMNGTYVTKNRTYSLEEVIKIRQSKNKLFEEDIFADFIEIDYCGVV